MLSVVAGAKGASHSTAAYSTALQIEGHGRVCSDAVHVHADGFMHHHQAAQPLVRRTLCGLATTPVYLENM